MSLNSTTRDYSMYAYIYIYICIYTHVFPLTCFTLDSHCWMGDNTWKNIWNLWCPIYHLYPITSSQLTIPTVKQFLNLQNWLRNLTLIPRVSFGCRWLISLSWPHYNPCCWCWNPITILLSAQQYPWNCNQHHHAMEGQNNPSCLIILIPMYCSYNPFLTGAKHREWGNDP